MIEYGLSVPPEVAATFRALATLEGTLTQLAPGFDLVAEARAFATRHGPGQVADAGTARQVATEELTALLPMLRRLPRRVDPRPLPAARLQPPGRLRQALRVLVLIFRPDR